MFDNLVRFEKAEKCKRCAHTKVCSKDLNICGERFVPGNPMFFDNNELYKKYEERKAKGFPCDDFLEIVRCKECKWSVEHYDTDGNVPYWVCKNWDYGTDADGFCYEGERRE